jgi:hypothetical protein
MKKSFVSDVASFAAGMSQLKVACPPASGHASKAEIQSVLREIKRAKMFVQSRGDQGTLLGLKSCSALNVLRRDAIPLSPDGFFNWLTSAEQHLETEQKPSSNVPYVKPNHNAPAGAVAPQNEPSFWETPWLNLGDYQITTKDILVGSIISILLSREGFRIYQGR